MVANVAVGLSKIADPHPVSELPSSVRFHRTQEFRERQGRVVYCLLEKLNIKKVCRTCFDQKPVVTWTLKTPQRRTAVLP